MKPRDFQAPQFGIATRTGASFWYFKPEPIPREIEFSPETILALSTADDALGRLASAGKYLPDPTVFVRPYITREALASSRIEGTQASLSDVFQAEVAGRTSADANVREVLNYIAAVDHGVGLLNELPISQRIVTELHRILMHGVRGRERRPGQLRQTHVFIGSPTDSPETATYVAPLHPSLPKLLTDWEKFANESPQLPVLIQCALLHYQFETIHPFMDGNGRIGRLLIVLFLLAKGRLPAPLLHVSSYLEERRRDYYDGLQQVRERGELQSWLQFFLTAVTVQANDAGRRSEGLFQLRERYRSELAGTRSRAAEVVDLLFENPFITSRQVESRLGVTNQGALNLIRSLEKRGWLRELGVIGRGRGTGRRGGLTYWLAMDVYGIIEEPTEVPEADTGDRTVSTRH
jgi:Fic family protein